MAVLVSPMEPSTLKREFIVNPEPERNGLDFLISSKMGWIGIQRKTIDDFLASIRDGRMSTQIIKSVNVPIKYMVIEGEVLLTSDGYMLTNWSHDITVDSFNKMLLSVGLEGYQVWKTHDEADTVRFIKLVEQWGSKDKHSTVSNRPGPDRDPWGQKGKDAIARYFLMGLPEVGPTTARNLYDMYGVPMVWAITEAELLTVPGIGKGKAKNLYEFLDGGL